MLALILTIQDENDKNFVEKLYYQYRKKIYLTALKILKNPADAEDCLQDVFWSILEHLELFQSAEKDQLIKLLVVCTRNNAINVYYKKKKIQESTDSVEDDIEKIPDFNAISADKILLNHENQKRIFEMIKELNPIYQDIIYLRYHYGMKHADIAHFLNISENLVKTRYCRAKKILLQRWREELNEIRENG
jgi:RNA polymerase sigma-70 factor (ECF subfamily)